MNVQSRVGRFVWLTILRGVKLLRDPSFLDHCFGIGANKAFRQGLRVGAVGIYLQKSLARTNHDIQVGKLVQETT